MRHKLVLLGTSALAWAAAASPAAAQTPAPATAPAAQQELGDIIITAQRRDSNLQTTPIAVSALDTTLIEQAAPRDLGDLSIYVPNFSAARITGFNAASFAMRGLGQNNIIVYYESPVAVLVDDFVMPSVQTQLLDTFDVEQVEVLRGPQGTLFGRNTTAGAVVVRTKKPVLGETSGEVRFGYGSFDNLDIKAAANIPIGDDIAIRIVGGYDYSDGYMKNGAPYGPVTPFFPGSKWAGVTGEGDGENVGGMKVFNMRAKLLWEPTDAVRLLAQFEFLNDRSESPAAVQETPTDGGFFLFNALGVGAPGGDPIENGGVTNRSDSLVDVAGGHPIDVRGGYLNADIDIGNGTLTSVTGYRYQKSSLSSTYTGVAPTLPNGEVLSLFDANRQDVRKTFQQELRYAGEIGDKLNYVVGGFYQHDTTDFCVAQLLGFLDLTGGPLPFGEWNQTPYILCNAQVSDAYALFFEGNYKLTDKLTFTGGFRYSWDEKTWRGRQQAFPQELGGGFDPTFTKDNLNEPLDASVYEFGANTVKVKENWAEPTWRFSLGYEASDDLFGYFTYSRGYKAGGFNDQIGSFAPFGADLDVFAAAAFPTDPETANSYELGFKSEFLDNRLRFNLTGFYVGYKDLQKQIVVPIEVDGRPFQVTTFFNAASATVKGIEAEATALLFDGFTLRGVLGYQDAKYNEYDAPGAGYDLSTAPLDRAPEWQWTLDATYQFNFLNHKMTVNGNAAYTSRNLFTQSISSEADNTFLDARTLFNASVTFAHPDDNYYVRFLARNLTDERYRTASQTVGGLWTFTLYGEPRWFGFEAGMKFGGR